MKKSKPFDKFLKKYFMEEGNPSSPNPSEVAAERDLPQEGSGDGDTITITPLEPETGRESQDPSKSRLARRRPSLFAFLPQRRKKKEQTLFRKLWRRFHMTKILLILIGVMVLAVGSWLFFLAKTANVEDLQAALQATTVIYDKSGNEAGGLSGQKGSYVQLDAIADSLEQAVIATEDRTFYENSGINFTRFGLAVVTFGKFGGGSTITQQLAKNAYLTQEQTISRKAKEFFLALELTKKYKKADILTMYLNNAYFGNGVWGVEDASLKYFGVSASQLSLSQSATLAGMLKGPEIYNPYHSVENATNRRNTVLQGMVATGALDQATADAAAAEDMASQLRDAYVGESSRYTYPSYFDAVIQEAIERYDLSESDIVNNGYRIYTELDQNYQANLQAIYNEDSLFPVAVVDGSLAQSASVVLDPKTGGVRALVGRVNSGENFVYRSFNYATQSGRSPGSTFKPLGVYTPALEAGWSINQELDNQTTTYGGYQLDNYGGTRTETGTSPMYQALAQSLNLPAAATLNELGIDQAFDYGKKFGLNMKNVPKELGLALGGGIETNPLQMAQAYAAFANEGVMNDAHLITRIETASGKVLKIHQGTKTRVMSKTVAAQMTSMMLGTFSNGTAAYAAPYNYIMAGKTGTTETSFNPNVASDQWIVGYTPDVVISQWLGFDKTDENHYLEGTSSNQASLIFQTVANSLLPYTEGRTFSVENAYAANGIVAINEGATTVEEDTSFMAGIQERAGQLLDQAQQAITEANIPEKAQNLWDTITNWFQ